MTFIEIRALSLSSERLSSSMKELLKPIDFFHFVFVLFFFTVFFPLFQHLFHLLMNTIPILNTDQYKSFSPFR